MNWTFKAETSSGVSTKIYGGDVEVSVVNLNLNLSVDGRGTFGGVWCPFPSDIDRRHSCSMR